MGRTLLAEAVAQGYALPLITGGNAPQGYLIDPTPWRKIISDGIKSGQISLDAAAPTSGIAVSGGSLFNVQRKSLPLRKVEVEA